MRAEASMDPQILSVVGKFVESLANVEVAIQEIGLKKKVMLQKLRQAELDNVAAYKELMNDS